jgi:HNH endonuclease
MNSIGPKTVGFRLDPVEYESLRQQVLRRDGWRCQSCGKMSHLEVHHKEFRSHAGPDSEENLITLCSFCHASLHGHTRVTRSGCHAHCGFCFRLVAAEIGPGQSGRKDLHYVPDKRFKSDAFVPRWPILRLCDH